MAVHIVKPGDSLWLISRMYNVSIPYITEVNGLVNVNSLVPGIALYIPDQGVPLIPYHIKSGDTLWALAARFNTSVQSIIAANPGINPNLLYIGQRIFIPSAKKLPMQTLGFILPYSVEYSRRRVEELASFFTYLAVVAYSFTSEGLVVKLLEDSQVITRSKELGVIPLLMIRNYVDEDFSAELAGQVLENPTSRANLVQNIVNAVREKGYGGVSIDLEFVPPARRHELSLVLSELKTELGNLILHVNVHAKTKDIPTNRIIGAYDYKAIGESADIVAVMTMDYGYPTGPPNPVSPAWWIEEVVKYSLTQIQSSKLQIAFPLYGYDWTLPENVTNARSILDAQNLAISTGAIIQYNEIASAPWYRYWRGTEPHIVWYEDIRSYLTKYNLVEKYNLLGVTYWQLNFSFPQNWFYMKNHIKVL